MPTVVKGKPVHLENIRSKSPDTGDVWETIVENIGDGRWFTITTTAHLSDLDKTKLFNSLVNRIWFAGYNADHLWLKVTEAEGVVFRWTCGAKPDANEIEDNRKRRLEARRVKQKAYRENKRKSETAEGGNA
jgi:hypothetical protein